MILDRIDFEYHEPFVQQVQLLVRVQQKIILAALVVRFQYIQEIGDVELLVAYPLRIQYRPVIRVHKLVESVERRHKAVIILNPVNEQGDRIGQRHLFRAGRRFIVLLPKRQEQCLDRFLFLHVKHLVLRKKGIETDRAFLRIGEIHPVVPVRLSPYHLAQPRIRITRIHQHDVRPLFPILPH